MSLYDVHFPVSASYRHFIIDIENAHYSYFNRDWFQFEFPHDFGPVALEHKDLPIFSSKHYSRLAFRLLETLVDRSNASYKILDL